MTVEVRGLSKTYRSRTRDVTALDEVDLQARDGELLVVVGPSGSGKTTLLRCIAGLERADSGSVMVGDREVTDLDPGSRDVAMVFQEYALYPHLTARENVAFGLRARKTSGSEIDEKVKRAAEMLSIERALDRRPSELSGGERQRIALARAIVREPTAFLMDEPLSNLDAELRTHTRAEIRALQRRLGTTTVYVTHDQVEAMTIGDRVAVLRGGRVEQVDPPMTLYDSPATAFVARFIGSPPMNVFSGDLLGGTDAAGYVGVRPEAIRLASRAEGRLAGRVTIVEAIGHESIVHIDVQGSPLLARVHVREAPAAGDEIGLLFIDADVHAFDEEGKAMR